MAPFAKQASDNKVIGIDAEGLVQRLILFDHCIIPSIWLKDIQWLLRVVDPGALCELIDTNAISFYIDSATAAEIGQARSGLNLTGNTTHLRHNEFSFSTIKGSNEPEKVIQAVDELARTAGVSKVDATSVAERIEGALLEPKGLEIHAASFNGFYEDLRAQGSTIVHDLIARRLKSLGAKPTRLEVSVEEFLKEDFRVNSNLTTTFGLSSQKAREITLRALLDLSSVHIRLAHMREFSCLLGMNEAEQLPWELKVDSLVREITRENQRDRQFTRVASIAGLGEKQLLKDGTIDLRRLISLRQSDDIAVFKAWLKKSDNKSDKEIRERFVSIRNKIANATQSPGGKTVRLMLSCLVGLIPNPHLSIPAGLALGATDLFLLDRILPRDAVLSLIGGEYPAIFRK